MAKNPDPLFLAKSRQLLTWEIEGRPTPAQRRLLSRQDFWDLLYLLRQEEVSNFDQFLMAQEDLMLLNGNVGVGKSTYVRHKFEMAQMCCGLIFDMVGRIGEFASSDTLHEDMRRMIGTGYLQALLDNYKALHLFDKPDKDYRDLTHEPDAEERNHEDWEAPRTENRCRTRLAIDAILHLQRDTKIWAYVNRTLGAIVANDNAEYEAELRSRFAEKGDLYTQEILELLDWKHYVILYHKLARKKEQSHIIVFDNLDWLKMAVIQQAFIHEALDLVRELRNHGLDIKTIVCVRDENVSYLHHNGGASTKMFQVRFSKEDYLISGEVNHYDLEVDEADFSHKVLNRRLHLIKKCLAEQYPEDFALFNEIVRNFWLLEGSVRNDLGYFRFGEFCNGSLRLMLELVHDCTTDLINRLRKKELSALPGSQDNIPFQTVRGSLICSLAHNRRTKDIMEAFYKSVLDELGDDYCCVYRMILVLLANQTQREPYTLRKLLEDLKHLSPKQPEESTRRYLRNLYFCGEHHGELVVIYQSKLIRTPDDIDLEATLQITGRGRVFIRTVLINFDFFKGVAAYQKDQSRPEHILFDMAPEIALARSTAVLKVVKKLGSRHAKFILSTIYPNLAPYKSTAKTPFEAYRKQWLTVGDNFHLERVCDNHKGMLKGYITECLRGAERCTVLLSPEEKAQLTADVKYDWIAAHCETKGTYPDEEVAPLVERLPKEHPLRRIWDEVYLAYTPVKDELTRIRHMGWGEA